LTKEEFDGAKKTVMKAEPVQEDAEMNMV